jgi:hypothetical protein
MLHGGLEAKLRERIFTVTMRESRDYELGVNLGYSIEDLHKDVRVIQGRLKFKMKCAR